MKCKKEKEADKGQTRLGGMLFCCNECCGEPPAGDKDDANTCEFC